MKETSIAVQELMRVTARLFDNARKLNMQMMQIDTFVDKSQTEALIKDFDLCKREYQSALQKARELSKTPEKHGTDSELSRADEDDQVKALTKEYNYLRNESVDKSEQIRRLLECVRQIQLTSAQLLQI